MITRSKTHKEALCFVKSIPKQVLSEIFMHCLPRASYPAEYAQPDVTIAPMLLCHICSSWRRVALDTPWLWAELSHTSYNPLNQSRVPQSIATWKLVRDVDIEFLVWWTSNLRSVPPSLCLEIFDGSKYIHRTAAEERKCNSAPLTPVDEQKYDYFFSNFVKSARVLKLDRAMTNSFLSWLNGSCMECPNLETLILEGNQGILGVLPSSNPNLLQRLRIIGPGLAIDSGASLQGLWTSLTRICLEQLYIHVSTWFTFIRQLINVELAWFQFELGDHGDIPTPSGASLPKLRQMHMAIERGEGGIPCDIILQNLQLPGLTALRLNSFLSAQSVNWILDSTPALNELHLGYEIPYEDETMATSILDIDIDVEPLSTSEKLPALKHVLFQLGSEYGTWSVADCIDEIISSHWLQLGQGTNNIQQIEIDYSLVLD